MKKANQSTDEKYKISVRKDSSFNLTEILDWIKMMCVGPHHYKKYKKNIIFYFKEVGDAFQFKLRWEKSD